MRKSKYFLLVASAVLVFVALISGGCGGSGGGTVAITGEMNENGTNENGTDGNGTNENGGGESA